MVSSLKNTCLLLVAVVGITTTALAQDPLLAQFYATPQYLNPAMTGVFRGGFRFNANYRQQWGGIFSDVPLKTVHAGMDFRLKVVDDDYFAFGASALFDEVGAASRLQTTRGTFSSAYLKQISGSRYGGSDQYLVFGAQVSAGQHRITTGNLWFSRQYDSSSVSVNNALPTGEVEPQSNIYPDFTAGLLWYMVSQENTSLYFGASVNHISQPNISFFNERREVIRRRFTVHGGGEVPFNDNLSLLPAAMLTLQGPSMTAIAGGNFRFSNNDWNEVAIRVGGWARLANRYVWRPINSGNTASASNSSSSILMDAFTITGMLEMDRWLIGISYDLHTSSINRPTNSRGAWEISLIYTNPERYRVNTSCPKF